MTPATPSIGQCNFCGQAATQKCPVCLQKKLPVAAYCSKDCFRAAWPVHKFVHEADAGPTSLFPSFRYTGPLRAYPQTGKRTVPDHIRRPDYADHPSGVSLSERAAKAAGTILVLNDEEIEGMRVAGRIGREVLDEVGKAIAVGVTTEELDRVCHEACIERECYPSPLGYYNFPKSCCTSVNEIVCHGIPDARPLENGDLCNVDVTIYKNGYHGDLNETFFVGDKVSPENRKLVQVTYECLMQAIAMVKPGLKYRELGATIQKHATANGLSVVKSFCGHGINKTFHTNPNVPHYLGNRAMGVMKAGHTFTIEPMINIGSHETTMWPDDWTAATKDGKPSAQFEHTLLVTDNGCDILTERAGGKPWFMDQLASTYSS
uniref:Methionine aminopeptidase n=1 Tax=Panagrellus redivivus TaxID=6233 RepID=A0A7E4UVS7_PANRE